MNINVLIYLPTYSVHKWYAVIFNENEYSSVMTSVYRRLDFT